MSKRIAAPAKRWQPRLEALESRFSPATLHWTAGASGSWHNPANWTDFSDNSHYVPGPNDNAIIDYTPQTLTITVTGAAQVKHAFVNEVLKVDGGSFTVSDPGTSTVRTLELLNGE